MYKYFFKRIIDFAFSLFCFISLSPIFLVITLVLTFINRGNPFFIQERPGKNERIFSILKFKTMNDKKDKYGTLLPDSDRLTRIGSFIRKTSLDEIPQLINVLKGDMSLIGPRPLLPEYLPLYSEFENRRHEIKPGITGWAQVNGRNAISWKQKFEYDVWYVDNISFLLDCRIVLQTVKKVFKREGITSENSVTAEIFKGNL